MANKVKVEIHDYAIKNTLGEWIDVKCHFDGYYIELKIETTDAFTIQSPEELEEIFQKIREFWPKNNASEKTQEK